MCVCAVDMKVEAREMKEARGWTVLWGLYLNTLVIANEGLINYWWV